MSENLSSKDPEHAPKPEGSSLAERVNILAERAEKLGVRTSFVMLPVQDIGTNRLTYGETVIDRDTERPVFGASLIKLGIAAARSWKEASENTSDTQLGDIYRHVWPASMRLNGTGFYDQPGSPEHASTVNLFNDLLGNSGETAARLLVGKGGAQEVNERLGREGYSVTRLLPVLDGPKKGWFTYGETTAPETAGLIMGAVFGDSQGHPRLQKTQRQALANNHNYQFGVRRLHRSGSPVQLFNKIGQFPAHSGVDYFTRHDAGVMINPATRKGWVYAMLTTSGSRFSADVAERTLGHMGHELFVDLGDSRLRVDDRLARAALGLASRLRS